MIKRDSYLRASRPCPYDLLAVAGITPDATMQQVKDASFTLMTQGEMLPEVRLAWDELRKKSRRLMVDFFLCRVDLSGVWESGQRLVAEYEQQPPVAPDSSAWRLIDPSFVRHVTSICPEIRPPAAASPVAEPLHALLLQEISPPPLDR